jgi:peptidoglycan/xylan/chitin deacetylase (PgdA/CDA1 family)
MTISIFLFHRVNPVRNILYDPVDPFLFEKFIITIQKKFSVVQLEEFLLNPDNITSLKKKPAAIVFDDGFKDNIDYALPILIKHKCPSSLYVVTDCINTGKPTWNFEIDHLLGNTKTTHFSFNNIAIQESVSLLNEKERIKFAVSFKQKLKSLPNSQRLDVIGDLRKQISDTEVPTNIMLNWDEVRTMYKEGVYIGSHTTSHPLLAKMNSETEIRDELNLSANDIQKELGYRPVTISYPMGSYNEKVKLVAKETGYKFGLAVDESKHDLLNGDLFAIDRIQLFNENWIKSWLRLHGYIFSIKKMIGY